MNDCGAMKFKFRALAFRGIGQRPERVARFLRLQILSEELMAITAHLAELAEKHRALEERIDQVVAHPGSDDIEIRRLKQEKLKLKDEIERLSRQTRH
jgi:hypothetical protein